MKRSGGRVSSAGTGPADPRLHPDEVAGVAFVDSTSPEEVARVAEFGIPFGGLGDPTAPLLRLQQPGVRQEIEGVEYLAGQVLAGGAFPAVPVVSLRAGPDDLEAGDPQGDAWHQALGSLGSPGETRRVADSGHYVQYDRPDAVTRAVTDVVQLATPAPTKTTLSVDPGTGTAGDRVTLTATVTGKAVTGSVTFRAGATVLGTAPVVDGRATLATGDLQAGTTTVTAAFAGDRKHLASSGTTTVRLAEPSAESRFVSSVLADAAVKYGIPGLTAAVVVGSRVTTGSAGVDVAGTPSPVRPGDLLQNGSTTKAMTATLAGVLVDRGAIRWDSTIGDTFPELRGKVRSEYLGVTLESLLQHRGGIIADEDASPSLAAAVAALDQTDPRAGRAGILPVVLTEPAHRFGEFRYSNAGYLIAAAMMERATGKAYESLMADLVFRPLGMSSATFGPPAASDPSGHDSTGHPVPYGGELYNGVDLPVLQPAGAALRMTVADWAKFVRVHLGQAVNGVQLLLPRTLARLHTPGYDEIYPGVKYAAGWGVAGPGVGAADPALGGFLQHQGSDGFWLAEVQAYPDRDFAVLIMANAAQTADGRDASVAFAEVKARLTERLAPKPAPADLPLSGPVAEVLQQVRAEAGVPAVAGGLIVNGQTAGLATVGVRVAGQPQSVADDAQFHIGSNAKSMTATLAAILVDKGAIRWDTTVGQLFPEIRNRLRPGYADVTLEDLLNHRGGLGDFTTEADVAKYESFQTAARFVSEGRQAYVRYWLTSVPPVGPRGEFHYSNIGYTLAGAMLERAADRGFETLMRQYVFQPLGMTSAVFGMPNDAGAAGQPLGHDENGSPLRPGGTARPDLLSPSGGISMTMADWAKYLRVHLGQPVNGTILLSDASLQKIHTPDPRTITDETGTYRYGFGWRTADTPLGEALGHEGAVPGFYSRVGIIPSLGVAVFSAVNELSEVGVAANTAVTTGLLGRLTGA